MQGGAGTGACGEHPVGAVRTARVVTHSMKCVSSYYIHVGVSWIFFYFTRTTGAAVRAHHDRKQHTLVCAGVRELFLELREQL